MFVSLKWFGKQKVSADVAICTIPVLNFRNLLFQTISLKKKDTIVEQNDYMYRKYNAAFTLVTSNA